MAATRTKRTKTRVGILVVGMLLVVILLSVSSVLATSTFRVQETDLVRLRAEASDIDNDEIVYTYSPPLNASGEWQTGYDDAGEYSIIITASDGKGETTQYVRLIVENRNRPPELTERKVMVKEGQTLDLTEFVKDLDDDLLTFTFEPPFDKNGVWTPSFRDEGKRVVSFRAYDGTDETTVRMEVEVLHTNNAPEIVEAFTEEAQIEVEEGDSLNYWARAVDDEGIVQYEWKMNGEVVSTEEKGEADFDYESAEEYTLELTVSDGSLSTTKRWDILIENVNRKPTLQFDPVTIHEGELVKLEMPVKDEDGDWLTYEFEAPLGEQGEWQTGYDDAGEYDITVTAFDGKDKTSENVEITVMDVDRAPTIAMPGEQGMLYAKEGERMEWNIEASDPDGDRLEITIDPLPQGAVLNSDMKKLTWTPNHDTIRRSGGFTSKILNYLRLEHFVLRSTIVKMNVTACAQELCSSQLVPVKVENVNRAPRFEALPDVTVTENEVVEFAASAVDLDGDIVHYYYTSPLGKANGKWQTKYGDKGVHTVYVTATDGRAGETVPVRVNVLKSNRAPTLKIADDDVIVNEGQQFLINANAADADGDEVRITLENLPEGASFKDGVFLWSAPYNTVQNKSTDGWTNFVSSSAYLNKKLSPDETVLWLRFTASDGEVETVHPVKVTVKNVNRGPQIMGVRPAEGAVVKLGQPVILKIDADDEDNEELTYDWDFGFRQEGASGSDTVERTFLSPGEKTIRVAVSDGREMVEKEWIIKAVQEAVEVVEEPVAAEPEQPPFSVKVYVVKSPAGN